MTSLLQCLSCPSSTVITPCGSETGFGANGWSKKLAYWRNQLRGFPTPLDLPTDYSRPPVRSGRGAREHIVLPQALCERLRLLSQRENVTLFAIVLAACQTLLARYTGQDDIVVGSPIAGRIGRRPSR